MFKTGGGRETPEVIRWAELVRYQELVGGLTFEQVMNEPPDWISFVLEFHQKRAEYQNRQHG